MFAIQTLIKLIASLKFLRYIAHFSFFVFFLFSPSFSYYLINIFSYLAWNFSIFVLIVLLLFIISSINKLLEREKKNSEFTEFNHFVLFLQVCDEVRRLRKEATKRHLNPMKDSTGIRYRDHEPMEEDQQIELLHRCETQQWVGVADVKFRSVYGRGLVSLQALKKDDIIVDYHGKVVYGQSGDDYVNLPGVAAEYCMVIAQNEKRIIDATLEHCELHPGNRCLGRLANHGSRKKGEANMVMTDIQWI